MAEHHEAIVIGSGFGGAVAAYRLAEKGVQTLVLERGRRWTVDTTNFDTFDELRTPSSWTAWLSKDVQIPVKNAKLTKIGDHHKWRKYRPGILEKIESPNMDVAVAACVGGGSVVYGCMMLQPDAALFPRIFGPMVTFAEMVPHYDTVRDVMGFGSPYPDFKDNVVGKNEYLATRRFRRDIAYAISKNAFAPGAVRLEQVVTAVQWATIQSEFGNSKKRSFIDGEYIYGANSGAKNSLDRNYLRRAEGKDQNHPVAKKALVRDLALVRTIKETATGYELFVEFLDHEGNRNSAHPQGQTFTCKSLFVCAGSLGSSLLMLRAKHEGTLGALGPAVGKGWGNNGDELVIRRKMKGVRRVHQGGPSADGFLVTEPGKHAVRVVHAPGPGRLNWLMQLGMSIPDQLGELKYVPRAPGPSQGEQRADRRMDARLQIAWPKRGDQAGRARVYEVMNRLNKVAKKLGRSTRRGKVVRQSSRHTYHPLGGMVLGQATDAFGRVKGYENKRLYVIDGALIPGHTACCNPAWTIAALAERCMAEIVAKDGL